MIVFKIVLAFFVIIAVVCLILAVLEFIRTCREPEQSATSEARIKSLEEMARNLETFEAWEESYYKAKSINERRVCEFEAMQAFENMEKAYAKLKKEMVKEIEK